jgi:hypothetical protein
MPPLSYKITGSYTRVRNHLCGTMYWDEGKSIGVKTCVKVEPKDTLKYQREEDVAQNKAKKPKVEPESAKECSLVELELHPPMLVHSRLHLHVEHY